MPFDNDVYAFVGTNGCGKSTIMVALSLLINPKNIKIFKENDYLDDSFIEFDFDGNNRSWYVLDGVFSQRPNQNQYGIFNGLYEGSLFYGTRFNDSKKVDRLVEQKEITEQELALADDYVREKLSYILHGDINHYKQMKRICNRYVADKLKLRNRPYFIEPYSGAYISQYRMSSGECLLISLLHFIYNSIIRKSLPPNKPIFVLIDEIELALHPIAIKRLLDLLNILVKQHKNLIVYLSSHSPEIIQNIRPRNILGIECDSKGIVHINTPCYPSYAIRDVYRHDGYDVLFLVEDELSRLVVKHTLKNTNKNRLIHVTPVGGWRNVLDLHLDLEENNVLGIKKHIISVLDGDIKEEAKSEQKYQNLTKMFLPFSSVEKFLYKVLIENENYYNLRRQIGHNYFKVESLDDVLSEYYNDNNTCGSRCDDVSGKKLYRHLLKNLEKHNIQEREFVTGLCDDIVQYYPNEIAKFKENLLNILRCYL